MRKCIAGDGSDSTAAVLAYLATSRQLQLCDLYVVHTASNYAGQYLDKTFLVTDYPGPLVWSYRGTFSPGVISRDPVTSKIGLDADTLDLSWSPRDSDVLATSGPTVLLTALQGLRHGIFDNGILEIWRCLMPTSGDANTFGACNMFTGRIGDVNFDRLLSKLTIVSRLETLNQQIPTNLIEPTNIFAQYNTGMVPTGAPTSFTIAAGTTVKKIFCAPAMSNAGVFAAGYLTITSGQLAGTYRRIMQQTVESGDTVFYPEFPLPFAPTVGDTLSAYTSLPLDYAASLALGIPFAGFPYVPNPIDSSVIV